MRALIRFLLDAFYIACFFVVMLALAVGADKLVDFLTAIHVDGDVVWMVRWLAKALVGLDVAGVGIAGLVSLFRFVRALVQEATQDEDSE